MKNLIICFLFTSLGYQLSSQSILETVERNNAFAIDLLKNTYSSDSNTFFSPYSLSTALAMTYAGARKETEKQMSKVLNFNIDQQVTHGNFEELIKALKRLELDSNIEFSTANALWKKETFPFHKDFLELCKKYYGTPVYKLEGAIPINDWTESKTKGKIDSIVTEKDLEIAQLVLTNAIYFKGDWLSKFDSSNTKKAIFNGEEDYEVEMMYQSLKTGYYENEQIQLINLPYKGESVSMTVVLPKPEYSIKDIIDDLNPLSFSQYKFDSKENEVKVYLPKFKIESNYLLNKNLKEMGMPDAFKECIADFSGMTSIPCLYIGKVLHKAFIEVNEQGSEAAAATAVIMDWKSARPDIVFKADRPFIYYITDNETNSILFIGCLLNPNE